MNQRHHRPLLSRLLSVLRETTVYLHQQTAKGRSRLNEWQDFSLHRVLRDAIASQERRISQIPSQSDQELERASLSNLQHGLRDTTACLKHYMAHGSFTA